MSPRLLAPLVAALALVAAAALAAFGDGFARPPSAAAIVRSTASPEPEEPSTVDDLESEDPGEDPLPPDHPRVDPAEGPLPPDHPRVDPTEGPLPPDHPRVDPAEGPLPPNHPPVDSAEVRRPDEPPAIAWTVPADWAPAPNPNTFRLATYRTPGGAELSVARAGGSIEANVARWASQFVEGGGPRSQTKTVHGLRITTVELAGKYEAISTGMGQGADEAPEPVDQALLAAIVETAGSPYFFKLLGPLRTVAAARPSFEKLVASIVPR